MAKKKKDPVVDIYADGTPTVAAQEAGGMGVLTPAIETAKILGKVASEHPAVQAVGAVTGGIADANTAQNQALATEKNRELRNSLAAQFPEGRVVQQGGHGATTNMTPEEQNRVLGTPPAASTVPGEQMPKEENLSKGDAAITTTPTGYSMPGGKLDVLGAPKQSDRVPVGPDGLPIGNGYTSASGLQVQFPEGTDPAKIVAAKQLGTALDKGSEFLRTPQGQAITNQATVEFNARNPVRPAYQPPAIDPAVRAAHPFESAGMDQARRAGELSSQTTLGVAGMSADTARNANAVQRQQLGVAQQAADTNQASTAQTIKGQQFELGQKQKIADLQETAINGQDPTKREAARQQLLSLGLDSKNMPTVHFAPIKNEMGIETGQQPYVYDPRNPGQIVKPDILGGEPQALPPLPKSEKEMIPGTQYTDATGNTVMKLPNGQIVKKSKGV